MDKAKLAKAFNEWLRRYEQEPERFQTEYQVMKEFLRDQAEGREPSYGDRQAAYLEKLLAEV